jgi:hypothetical protein
MVALIFATIPVLAHMKAFALIPLPNSLELIVSVLLVTPVMVKYVKKSTIALITPLVVRIFVLILDLVLLNASAVIQMPILQEKNVFVVLVLVAMV